VLPKTEADLPDTAAADRGVRLSLRRDAPLRAADAAAESRGGGAQVPAAPGVPLRPVTRYSSCDARGPGPTLPRASALAGKVAVESSLALRVSPLTFKDIRGSGPELQDP
jgi:hypothetical protein